ncbi:MAG: hypothetical protein C4570_08285 [Ammonifex sp.]|nr:MAG: hypothetical protein C4570_08285 [Ammonifex sp.]
MDEFLDHELGDERRELLEKRRQVSAHTGKLEKAFQEGNLEQVERVAARLEAALGRQQEVLARLKERLPSFDVPGYLREVFDAEFVAACRSHELQVSGSFPAYEVFPFRVRVHPDRRLVEVNERVVRLLRPRVFAAYLQEQKNRLYKESFNPVRFIDALASVYDTILAVRQANSGVTMQRDLDVALLDVYDRLTPLPAQRRQYPLNMFAFDLHRLYLADAFTASDGRRLVLGAVRQRSRALVVYDAHGRDLRYGSLRFTGKGDG